MKSDKQYLPKPKPRRTPAKAKSGGFPQRDTFTALASAELGVTVVKEYRFHPKRMWRFDYAIPEYRVAIEIDGGVWTQGRHTRPKGYLGDLDKFNAAASMGWVVLKFTPANQYSGETMRLIRETVDNRKREKETED
ncbi:MAG: endonuclease domain-containing protein [Bacteroidales bacterium]|nr:endonuclease domain-containing protein [Bacteroidales bacterium]